MIAWIPWKEGHTFEGTVTPVPESPPWHESRLNEMPMKNLKVKTVPSMISELPGANPFPFERYETELIFGFNATGMMVSTGFKPRAWLSWDLEQGGVWNASVRVNVTDPSSVTEWDGAEDLVRSQNLTSFFSVVISLSHLPSYVYKMVVPTWGPFVFLFTLLVMQFRVVRRQLRRGDHVGMFIGASVFTLGQALMMREVTPPELTLAELATFTLAMIYLIALVVVIGRRSHAPDADGPTSLPSNHHESNPLAIAVTALSG
jgi:hypothetical protein